MHDWKKNGMGLGINNASNVSVHSLSFSFSIRILPVCCLPSGWRHSAHLTDLSTQVYPSDDDHQNDEQFRLLNKIPQPTPPFAPSWIWTDLNWIEMKWNPCIDLAVAQLPRSVVSQSEVKFKQIICIEPLCLLLVIFVHICSCFPLLKALPKSPYVVNNSGK